MKGTVEVKYEKENKSGVFNSKPHSATLTTRNGAEVHIKLTPGDCKKYEVALYLRDIGSIVRSWILDKEAALDFGEFFTELAKYMD